MRIGARPADAPAAVQRARVALTALGYHFAGAHPVHKAATSWIKLEGATILCMEEWDFRAMGLTGDEAHAFALVISSAHPTGYPVKVSAHDLSPAVIETTVRAIEMTARRGLDAMLSGR